MDDGRPIRRLRANSVGGSSYESQNSGDVVRTDKVTGEKSTISGRQMHEAVEDGALKGSKPAQQLAQQIVDFDKGKGLTDHAPMGCAEARAEAAIAAHHIAKPMENPKLPPRKDKDGFSLQKKDYDKLLAKTVQAAQRNHIISAWANSKNSTYSGTTNDSGASIQPCENCGRRGHKSTGRNNE